MLLKRVDLSPDILVITLNVNLLHVPIKRKRCLNWINNKTSHMLSTRDTSQAKDAERLKEKERVRYIKQTWIQKKASIARSSRSSIDLKAKSSTKEHHFILIKDLVHQEDTLTLTLDEFNNITSKCIKQKLIEQKGETDKPRFKMSGFLTPIRTDRTKR